MTGLGGNCVAGVQAVGPLLELCREAEGSSATALAIVSVVIQRHLSHSTWLPLLQQACAIFLKILYYRFISWS